MSTSATPPAATAALRVMSHRMWPAVLAYPTLVVFGYVILSLLWGPAAAVANLGTGLTWILWWPVIPLALFAFGRLWCAVCPFGTLVDLVQKAIGLRRPVPAFLKRRSIWIIDALFIAITWADHAFGIVESPRASGYLLSALVAASVVSAVVFERRAWCRYLCFLGGLSSNYARSTSIELVSDRAICANCKVQYCYLGTNETPGCPMFEAPRAINSMAHCNLCGNCTKACPNGSLRIQWRRPTSELWFIRRPRAAEASLAVVIVGIVLLQNLAMLPAWQGAIEALESVLFGSRLAALTVAFAAVAALPFAVVLGAAAVSRSDGGETILQNFARFGYAVIPLDFAAHMAHNLFHLLSEGGALFYSTLGVLGIYATGPIAVLSEGPIRALQFGLVVLGILGALFTAGKIARRAGSPPAAGYLVPHLVALTVLGLLNVYLFTLPMAHRV